MKDYTWQWGKAVHDIRTFVCMHKQLLYIISIKLQYYTRTVYIHYVCMYVCMWIHNLCINYTKC